MDNREKILALAQQEHNNNEYENKMFFRGDNWATVFALFMGVVMLAVEYGMHQTLDYGILALMLCVIGVPALFDGIKLKKVTHIIYGVVVIALSVLFFLAFIGKQVM